MPNLAVATKTVTPAEALKLVQDHVKAQYAAAKKAPAAEFKAIAKQVGGQVDKLDREVVEDLKKFAIRLAAIARRSGAAGYNTNKAAPAIQAVSKKLFMAAAELEAVVANDVEIPLFAPPSEDAFFGSSHQNLKNARIGSYDLDPQAFVDEEGGDQNRAAEMLKEELAMRVGEGVQDSVQDLLASLTIVMPEASPDEEQTTLKKPAKAKSTRTRNVGGAIYEEDEPDEGDDE